MQGNASADAEWQRPLARPEPSMPSSKLSLSRRPRTPNRSQGHNTLLAGLTPTAYAALVPHLVSVSLVSGQVLHKAHATITNVYFPDSVVLSLLTRMSDGRVAEVGTIGHEGIAGLSVLFGIATTPTECVTQIPGAARRLSLRTLRQVLREEEPFRDRLLRYAHTFLYQSTQRSACNSLHSVSERCARWLLVADDTAGGTADGFLLTQEYLAHMLGVRREGVSAAARTLRKAGLIHFSRGRIRILDRAGLEAASCECYELVSTEYRRTLASMASDRVSR